MLPIRQYHSLTQYLDFKSKNSDMMGILIALFDPIDIFLKEFQNVMGDRLLRKESEFDNEVPQRPLLNVFV